YVAQLLWSSDGGHSILARARRRTLYGLVPAFGPVDDFPAESRRPRRVDSVGRRLDTKMEATRLKGRLDADATLSPTILRFAQIESGNGL
ncbi:MAG: hypothetical protein ACI9HK_005194, partial [Pirellulaceae bacterium]